MGTLWFIASPISGAITLLGVDLAFYLRTRVLRVERSDVGVNGPAEAFIASRGEALAPCWMVVGD